MAAVQERINSYRLVFRHEGKQHVLMLGRVAEAEAKAKSAQVDSLLMRLKQGLISLPAGAGIVDFVRHDGNPPPRAPEAGPGAPKLTEPTLGDLRDRYLETHGNGSLEAPTLKGIRRHFSRRRSRRRSSHSAPPGSGASVWGSSRDDARSTGSGMPRAMRSRPSNRGPRSNASSWAFRRRRPPNSGRSCTSPSTRLGGNDRVRGAHPDRLKRVHLGLEDGRSGQER
jgi:hypothetical protein